MYKFDKLGLPEDQDDFNMTQNPMANSADVMAPPQPTDSVDPRDALKARLMADLTAKAKARIQQGKRLTSENEVTASDLQKQNEQESLRALQGSLQNASDKMGSIAGKVPDSSGLDRQLQAMNVADRNLIKGRQDLFDKGVNLEDSGMQQELTAQDLPNKWKTQQVKADELQADYDWNEAPVNEYSRAITESALEKQGMGGKIPWDKIKNRDLERNPFLKGAISRVTTAQAGKPVYQKLLDADGVVRLYALHPNGTKEVVGDAGFVGSVRTDPVTGGIITVNPNRGTGAVGGGSVGGGGARSATPASAGGGGDDGGIPNTALLPGETVKQRDVRVDLEKDKAKEGIKSDAKNEGEVAAAATEQYRVGELTKRLTKLRKEAMFSGPVGGRVGSALNGIGFSAGKDSDKLGQALAKELTDYIKATTGATATEDEMVRLSKFIPSINDDKDLFANKMEGLEQTAQAIVNEKLMRAKRGRTSSQQPATTPQQPVSSDSAKAKGGVELFVPKGTSLPPIK